MTEEGLKRRLRLLSELRTASGQEMLRLQEVEGGVTMVAINKQVPQIVKELDGALGRRLQEMG